MARATLGALEGVRAALDLLGPPTLGTQRLLAHWAARDGGVEGQRGRAAGRGENRRRRRVGAGRRRGGARPVRALERWTRRGEELTCSSSRPATTETRVERV